MATASLRASRGYPCDRRASTRAQAVGTCSAKTRAQVRPVRSRSRCHRRSFSLRLISLTVPQGPPSRIQQGAVQVAVVTVVGVVVRAEDVLQVGVLPVKVTGLDGSSEHGPVGSHQQV